jgi:hypothetical protein
MREIKFRGKILEHPELDKLNKSHKSGWAIGEGYCRQPAFDYAGCGYLIADTISKEWLPIKPETFGECSNRKCKNNVVFEGDVLYDTDGSYYQVKKLGSPDWLWMLDNIHDSFSGFTFQDVSQSDFEKMVLVGNIHDNKELLETDNA